MNFQKSLSNYYDKLNIRGQSDTFQFEEDTFEKDDQCVGKYYHEVLLLMKFLQTKLCVMKMKINY